MHRVVSQVGQAVFLGIAALSLSVGPTGASGISRITTPVTPPSTQTANVIQTPVDNVPTLVQLPAQYSPSLLDLGTLKGYKNEEHTATLSITAPADGTVSAFLLQGGPIQISSMSRFGPRSAIRVLNGPLETTGGNGELHAAAGNTILVDVTLKSNNRMPALVTGQLEVVSHRWHVEVPVRAWVVQEPEIVVDGHSDEVKIVPGREATATIHLRRTRTQSFTSPSGTDKNVTITAPSLPAGLTMDPLTVRMPVDEVTKDLDVHLHAADQAPAGWDQWSTLLVETGGDRSTLKLRTQVYPTSKKWEYRQKVGDVDLQATITFDRDGNWHWWGHLHDSGVVMGDFYDFGWGFNLAVDRDGKIYPEVDAAHGIGAAAMASTQGVLGALTGPSRDADFDLSSDNPGPEPWLDRGPDPWLRAHYIEAYDAGFVVAGYSSPDALPVTKAFVDWIWDFARGGL